MRRVERIGAGVACLLLLAGCTRHLDMGKVKGLITEAIAKSVGAPVKGVTCPETRDAKAGDTFECTAEIEYGKVPFTVTQTDGSGTVSVQGKMVILKVAEMEKLVIARVKEAGHQQMTADCGPKFRPSTPNDMFD